MSKLAEMFGTPSTDFHDIIKINAQSGRMFAQMSDPDSRTKTDEDITDQKPVFLFDFPTMKLGWLAFTPNGPVSDMLPADQGVPARPEDHALKPGFYIVLSHQTLGLRDLSSNAKCVVESILELRDRYLGAPEAALGQVPEVELSRFIPVTSGSGARKQTFYAPTWRIVGWRRRDVQLFGEATNLPPPAARTATPAPKKPPVHGKITPISSHVTGTRTQPFWDEATLKSLGHGSAPTGGSTPDLDDEVPF